MITYATKFLREDEDISSGYITTFKDGGITVVKDDSGYTAFFDYFQDNPDINDAWYFRGRCTNTFGGFKTDDLIPISSDAHTLAWEYFNGITWVSFSNITDGTNGLRQNGEVTWDVPSDWEKVIVNGTEDYYFRCRLVSFTNITEGGRQGNYICLAPDTIIVSGGVNETPASIKNASDNAGWGVVAFENGIYEFSKGVNFINGDGSTFTIDNCDIICGTENKPAPFIWESGNTYIFNNDPIYYTPNKLNFLKIYSVDTAKLEGDSNSIINNIALISDKRINLRNNGSIKNCNIGRCVPYGSPSFNRVNFVFIEYLLTSPDATYNDCYINGNTSRTISVDPTYIPILQDSVFDTSTGSFLDRHFPNDKAKHHYFKAIDCQWLNGSRLDFDEGGENDLEQNFRHIYSHIFNLKITDENGAAIENATITLKDQYGNSQIFINTGATNSGTYNMTDTDIDVSDGTKFSVGSYYKIAEEIIKVTDINANTLSVERAKYNTTPYHSIRTGISFYKMEDSISTDVNGDIAECEIIEWAKFKYGDGLVTETYTYTYSPYTINISKYGYRTYQKKFTLNSKVCWQIALQSLANVPSEDDVESGVTYDDGENNYTGNLQLPAASVVKKNEQYGANGTEFTGTYLPEPAESITVAIAEETISAAVAEETIEIEIEE